VSFADLRRAADDGPVVLVNISRYRCDALTVTASGVTVTPLDITAAEVEQMVTAFVAATDEPGEAGDGAAARAASAEEVLAWLFGKIADPVLRQLGLTAGCRPEDAPRLWWCPTGLLSFLPFHAARGTDGQGPPPVLDRVASSYTPTLRALLSARSRPAEAEAEAGAAMRTLIVSLPATPGYPPLPGAAREAERVQARVPGALVLAGEDATVDGVSRALAEVGSVHLICHGEQDLSAPGAGCLRLYDGPLTVRALAGLRIPHGRLAVLNGCETVRGGVELSDEALTLAAAVQLAGFRAVIGTLWPVGDAVAVRFADLLYGGLPYGGADAGQAATARLVHLALHRIRGRYGSPVAWAPFAHTGP
jgi:CHAT domain-containing protein